MAATENSASASTALWCQQGSPSTLTVPGVMSGLAKVEAHLMLCKVRKSVLAKMESQFALSYNNQAEGRCV